MRIASLGPFLLALGATVILAACATEPARRSSGSPTVRCVDEPGRGQTPETTRPLFFLFCAQSP